MLLVNINSCNFVVFENGICQQIAAHTEPERDSWLKAIKQASYEIMRAKLVDLRKQLEVKRKPDLDINMWRLRKNQPKLGKDFFYCVSYKCLIK